MRVVAEAKQVGLSQGKAAQALGLSVRALEWWQQAPRPSRRRGNPRPWNALLPAEHAPVAEVVPRRPWLILSRNF